MTKKLGLLLATVFMLGPALGQTRTTTDKPNYDEQLNVCVPRYVAKYAVLCETAEIAAWGVAYACSPKPLPKGPSSEDNSRYAKGLAWDYTFKEAAHEQAYAKALVAILDARALKPLDCPR